MRLLILGGTIFYGRHVTEMALQRGHEVTLFTRGVHDTGAFPGAEKRQGDRDGSLDALQTGEWDAVLDTCGYVPRVVHDSCELLRGRTGLYAFVSSISVYADDAPSPLREDSPVQKLDDLKTEIVTGETYGGLKALCEEAVRETMAEKSLVIRPGLNVGPYDSSDRFTYWPWRLSRSGDALVPDLPGQAVQFVDARDLAAWTLDLLEKGTAGTFHATGPETPYTLGETLERVQAAVEGKARQVPVAPAFLEEQGVKPWTELPLYHGPEGDSSRYSDVSRAVQAGLRFRSLEETARDTLAFALSRGSDHPWRNGLPAEKERRVLEAWRSRAEV
jgi:2'-hydroxyisoflavone reductase